MDKKAVGFGDHKNAFYFSVLTIFTSLTVAQDGLDLGGTGVAQDSMLGLVSQMIGIQINSPVQFIGVVSAVAIFGVAWYVILKVGTEKIGLKDTLTPGRDGGRNILAVLAALITLSAFGSGYVGMLIERWQDLVVFTWSGGILLALAYVLFGGAKFGVTGFGSISAANKLERAKVKGKEADAEEKLKEAENRLHEVKNEDENGMDEEAIKDLEAAIQVLAQSEKDLDDVLEADIRQLREAVNEARTIYGTEERELELDKHIQDIYQNIRSESQYILNDNWNTPNEVRSRLKNILDELQEVLDSLNNLEKAKSVEENLSEELEKIEDAAKGVMESVQILRTLKKELEQGEAEFDHLAQELGHRQEIGAEAQQIQELKNRLETLERMEREAAQELEGAKEVLEKQLGITEEEAKTIRKLFEGGGKMEQLVSKMRSHLNSKGAMTTNIQGILTGIEDGVENKVRPSMKEHAEFDKKEVQEEQRVIQEINNVLNKIRS